MDSEREDAARGPADDGLTQEQRAQAAIRRIMREGADPGAEALSLANRFTDERTSKLGRWWRRRRNRD